MTLFSTPHGRGALSLALTCLLTLLLNQMEMARDAIGKFQLRGGDDDRRSNEAPLGDDLDPGVPECARDAFLKLRGEGAKEGEEEGERRPDECRGMLVRDDIILTSAACARFEFTFEFPDKKAGRVRAVPLRLIKEKRELVDPRLGFLKAADSPKHYYFADHPTMRTRMFLSKDSSPGIDGFEDGAILSCEGRRPIAHNFPAEDGAPVPLGHLSKVLPGDVLWKERDLATAPMLSDDSTRWWTRRVSLEEEEKKFQSILEEYRGPPGSVSIPTAHVNGPISQAGGLAEAIDPRGHRRQNCFKNYYFRWRNAPKFSGQRFFDWLDYGEGKDLMKRNDTEEMIVHDPSDLDCHKDEFDAQRIHYFDDDERAAREVYFAPAEDGRGLIARYKATDGVVPPSPENWSKEENPPHIYVWDTDKRFYVVDDTWDAERFGEPKHTAVLAGRPALSAGMCHFGKGGKLRALDFASGHYRPGYPALSMMYRWMKDQGYDVTSFAWIGRTMWDPAAKACKETDWEGIDIEGFTVSVLERSCHEVTSGKAYIRREDDRR